MEKHQGGSGGRRRRGNRGQVTLQWFPLKVVSSLAIGYFKGVQWALGHRGCPQSADTWTWDEIRAGNIVGGLECESLVREWALEWWVCI